MVGSLALGWVIGILMMCIWVRWRIRAIVATFVEDLSYKAPQDLRESWNALSDAQKNEIKDKWAELVIKAIGGI